MKDPGTTKAPAGTEARDARDEARDGSEHGGGQRPRVPYAEAGAVARDVLRRARAFPPGERLGIEDHAVLEAVIAHTALFSKLEDEVTHPQLGEAANVHVKNVGPALRRLACKLLIAYTPGRGRPSKEGGGPRSRVALLPSLEKAAPVGCHSDQREMAADPGGKWQPPGADPTEGSEEGFTRPPPLPEPPGFPEAVAGLRLLPDERALLAAVPVPQLRSKLAELRGDAGVRSPKGVLLAWARRGGGQVAVLDPDARARAARVWFTTTGSQLEQFGFDEELTRKVEAGLPLEVADELRQAYDHRQEAP